MQCVQAVTIRDKDGVNRPALAIDSAGDPASCALLVVSGSEWASVQVAAPEPFDYAQGAAFWSVAFVFTVGLWLVSRSAGAVLQGIKDF